MRKKIIRTRNKEIYKKLKMLHIVDEVIIENTPKSKIQSIVRTLNSDGEKILCSKIGDSLRLKKIGPLNFEIYI